MPWTFLIVGYCISVAVETPILMLGLLPEHPLRRRFLAGLWLTACTYPIVIIVLPDLLFSDAAYTAAAEWLAVSRADEQVHALLVVVYTAMAETFAPLAECALFLAAF